MADVYQTLKRRGLPGVYARILRNCYNMNHIDEQIGPKDIVETCKVDKEEAQMIMKVIQKKTGWSKRRIPGRNYILGNHDVNWNQRREVIEELGRTGKKKHIDVLIKAYHVSIGKFVYKVGQGWIIEEPFTKDRVHGLEDYRVRQEILSSIRKLMGNHKTAKGISLMILAQTHDRNCAGVALEWYNSIVKSQAKAPWGDLGDFCVEFWDKIVGKRERIRHLQQLAKLLSYSERIDMIPKIENWISAAEEEAAEGNWDLTQFHATIEKMKTTEAYLDSEREANFESYGRRETNSEKMKRLMADAKQYKMDLPIIMVKPFQEAKLDEDDMLVLWKSMGCPSPSDEKKGDLNETVAQIVIDILCKERAYPSTIKRSKTKIPALLEEINRLYDINARLSGFATTKEETPGRDVVDRLIDMSKKHPTLLDAVLDEKNDQWTQEKAIDLLHEKFFDDHPDAVLEVLAGGHWKAAAMKRDLIQL